MHHDDLLEILVKLHINLFNSELRPRRYEQNKTSMATVQDAPKHQANTLQTCKQYDIMILHANSHKFHIRHTQNGATG